MPAGTTHEELDEKLEHEWPAKDHISYILGEKSAMIYRLPARIFKAEKATFIPKETNTNFSFTMDSD